MSSNIIICLILDSVLDHSSDDDSSEYENNIEDDYKDDDVDVLISHLSTSSKKKKRSSLPKKNKSDSRAAKRLRFDEPTQSLNVDEQQLDVSQIINYMKELNQNNNHLLKQQRQIMLTNDRIETTLKFLLKNQKKIAKAMNQKDV